MVKAVGDKMAERMRIALEKAEKKPVDLSRDLKIPKSAISQYLSGRSKRMPSERLYMIAEYLNVSEAWLMGFDIPMERIRSEMWKKSDEQIEKSANRIADLVIEIETNEEFIAMLEEYLQLPELKKAQVREYVHLLSGKD